MFKTLSESIAKERPEVQARIVSNGDKMAAKRDEAFRAATVTRNIIEPVEKRAVNA